MKPSSISNIKQLAGFLRCSEEFLAAYFSGDIVINDKRLETESGKTSELTTVIDKLYLRKKDAKHKTYREIYSVRTDTFKSALKTFNTFLQLSFKSSDAVHGYVVGKNIRTNAEAHLAKKFLISVDIQSFFETISAEMVKSALQGIGYSDFAAEKLSRFVTLNNFLPPGYNTSPTLSNLVVKEMDQQFLTLCGGNCTYTRYADDLYFSSNIAVPTQKEIEAIIHSNGFALNSEKTKLMPRGQKQYVTGLTVFDHIRPHVSRNIKRKLRLQVYYICKHGWLGHVLYQEGKTLEQYVYDKDIRDEVNASLSYLQYTLGGWMQFLKSVERPFADKLDTMLKQAPRSI